MPSPHRQRKERTPPNGPGPSIASSDVVFLRYSLTRLLTDIERMIWSCDQLLTAAKQRHRKKT